MTVDQATGNGVGQTTVPTTASVREDVRKMILTGELKPGSRLTQQHLAKKFGVAQSVVRESLLELQASGLVRSVDNLGIFVSDLDEATLIHAYHVREMIEGLAARLCCERANRSDIRALYEIADKMHEDALSQKVHERGVLDREFHHRTIIISANPLLMNLTDSYQMLNMVVQVLRDHELILSQHRGIVEAIERGDCGEAERRALEHDVGSRVLIEEAIANGKFEPRWVLD